MPRGVSPLDEARLQGRLWSPALLRPELWLDADDLSTISTVNGAVNAWRDKSGNARTLSQANSGKQPLYQATGFNSRPTVTFDGTDDFMNNASYSFGNSASSVYIAFQSTNAAGTLSQLFMASPVPSNTSLITELLYLNNFGGYQTITYKPPSLSSSSLGVNTPHITTPQILTASFDGSGTSPSDVAFSINGVLQTSTTSGPVGYGPESGFSIGGRPLQGLPLKGGISELVFFNSFHSTSERQIIKGYLAHKWGLNANLPANHPYRNRPPLIGA